MAKFEEKDFYKMRYNVAYLPPGKSVLERFETLNAIKSFHLPLERLDKDKILRWIVLYFSKDCPLNAIENQQSRLTKSMEYAKMTPGVTNEWPSRLIDACRGKNKTVNKMIFDYLRLNESVSYSIICTMENQVFNILEEIHAGDLSNVNQLEKIESQLRERKETLLNNTENNRLHDKMSTYMAEETILLSPEAVAQAMKDNVEVYPELSKKSSSGFANV